jgi:GNAT superfamily N-acetyltransferase
VALRRDICYNFTNASLMAIEYFCKERVTTCMAMSDKDIETAVRAQLATDLNCAPDDFDRDGFVFCESKDNPGRRPFPRGERHFEMLTMGGAVIVSATPDILPYIRKQLDGKTRDEAYSMPFIYGTVHYFIPDNPRPIPMPDGFDVNIVERDEIMTLYRHKGFDGAMSYNINHPRPDMLAATATATADGSVVGVACASADCEMLWQIGIVVVPECRRLGLAAALTNRLAIKILERGKVPYYGTLPGNIASQRVAHRAGFKPMCVCDYRGRFDGELTGATG